ncbi:hypothetical protein CHM34_05090 [Paludifilum halophilum]|uniref:Uncharacterized protein n=1 Tax=Paludifilum halophilum TaxID=1642702 RepID=A0A235BA43_9BACL|nr:hypothetical protein CHM34_05090 [Paludifilum halophilum]
MLQKEFLVGSIPASEVPVFLPYSRVRIRRRSSKVEFSRTGFEAFHSPGTVLEGRFIQARIYPPAWGTSCS